MHVVFRFDPVKEILKIRCHFDEGSDYFGKMKSFAPPQKETKHVHVSAADLHSFFL